MIALSTNQKELIEFLLNRWQILTGYAATECVYAAMIQHNKKHNLPTPIPPPFIACRPCDQIEIVKQQIIKILPQAQFINYIYQAPMPLDPNDFVELYMDEQDQCIDKVRTLIEQPSTEDK